jgi:hypothetical protein
MKEYSGLVAGENADKETRIISVLHKMTPEDLAKKSPTIANRLALLTSNLTVAVIAQKIAERVRQGMRAEGE